MLIRDGFYPGRLRRGVAPGRADRRPDPIDLCVKLVDPCLAERAVVAHPVFTNGPVFALRQHVEPALAAPVTNSPVGLVLECVPRDGGVSHQIMPFRRAWDRMLVVGPRALIVTSAGS